MEKEVYLQQPHKFALQSTSAMLIHYGEKPIDKPVNDIGVTML